MSRNTFGWVSTKDRLPPPQGYVIVCTVPPPGSRVKRRKLPQVVRASTLHWRAGEGFPQYTYWMAIPALPIAGDDETL